MKITKSSFFSLMYILLIFGFVSKCMAAYEIVWENPVTIADLHGIWKASSGNMYAVGSGGTIIYYNGSAWATHITQTSNSLQGVWGAEEKNVYAVGDSGTILHFDGTAWSQMQSGSGSDLKSIWGTAGNNIFSVGTKGAILHFDGTSWSSMKSSTTADLYAVWGISPADVFAGGDNGTILHYDGSSWKKMDTPSTASLKGICGSASDKVFAVGNTGTILLYNGSSWSVERTGSYIYNDILGVLAINQITNGIQTDFIVVGNAGRAAYYNGSTWSEYDSNTGTDLYSVCGTDSSALFISGGAGNIFKKDAAAWSSFTYVSKNIRSTSVWGFELVNYGRDIFIPGYSGSILYKKDCDHLSEYGKTHAACKNLTASWQPNYFTAPDAATVYGSWGYIIYVSSYLFSAGEGGTLFRLYTNYDRWTEITTNTTKNLYDIWGFSYSSTDLDIKLFAVGDEGTIIYYDGSECSQMNSVAAKNLRGVWGSAADDMFAVGSAGTILHYDGSAWAAMVSGTTKSLMKVWGSAADDVFAVGLGGTILHYDGTTWSAMSSGVTVNLNCIWGLAPDNIFVGGDGAVLNYDGKSWNKIDTGADKVFWQDVWGSAYGELFFVGINGEVLRINTEPPSGTTTTTTTPGGGGTTTTTRPSGGTTTTTVAGHPPSVPVKPYPDDNATNVSVTATLQWELENSNTEGVTFDVYFGTEEIPLRVAQNINKLYYSPESMNPDTTYYWKILARNESGAETEGPVWRFTTGAEKPCVIVYIVRDREKLDRLRQYRDRVLSKTPLGRKIIVWYYECSAGIIKAIDRVQSPRE